MSNWTSIAEADLRKVGDESVIDAAVAKSASSVDEAIADAVSAVRGAVSAGNQLDIDPTKVPESLKALTARIAFYSLMTDLLFMELTHSQSDSRKFDHSRLNRITDEKLRFEQPDVAGGSAEMQDATSSETVREGNCGNSREELRGL